MVAVLRAMRPLTELPVPRELRRAMKMRRTGRRVRVAPTVGLTLAARTTSKREMARKRRVLVAI